MMSSAVAKQAGNVTMAESRSDEPSKKFSVYEGELANQLTLFLAFSLI